MSDERTNRDESTESLHREIHEVTQPDTSAHLEDRIASTQELPDRIGPFKILELLGEGGFGVVYLAEQTKPVRRRVALKVIKPGMDSRAVLARFEAEEQALALMNHPNVAKVFSAGTTRQGRPYFVMEHVPGIPITEHCDRHKLNIEERLNLFQQVCQAVQHAHQKGVIHRDIKPSNILVAFKDSPARPHAANGGAAHPPLGKGGPGGVPKVIDFGVAKAIEHRLSEKTIFTEQGQLIGTPEYMSPEQAEMTAQDIDTRTDIYSLGVLLYELLTGALPFDPRSLRRAAFDEIRRIIREVEPPKPSTKVSSLSDADNATTPEPQASACADVRNSESEPRAQATGPEPRASARANVPISEGAAPVEGTRGILESERFAQAKACGSGAGRGTDQRSSTAQQIARRRRTDPSALIKLLRGEPGLDHHEGPGEGPHAAIRHRFRIGRGSRPAPPVRACRCGSTVSYL